MMIRWAIYVSKLPTILLPYLSWTARWKNIWTMKKDVFCFFHNFSHNLAKMCASAKSLSFFLHFNGYLVRISDAFRKIQTGNFKRHKIRKMEVTTGRQNNLKKQSFLKIYCRFFQEFHRNCRQSSAGLAATASVFLCSVFKWRFFHMAFQHEQQTTGRQK